MSVDGHAPLTLHAGDFVLVPSPFSFGMSSLQPPRSKRDSPHVVLPSGEYRLGDPNGPPDVRMLVGYCVFGSPDASLLVGLLPQLVHVRGEPRLSTLFQLVRDETRADRPAREVILSRLLEVLLIEALRSGSGTAATPGLVRGLGDERIATAIRQVHDRPAYAWSVVQLARAAGLSRSAFFQRFSRTVGVAPMEYLLGWRMALAKDLLRRQPIGVAEVAERVGYGSASAFSVAFTRFVGEAPSHYARTTGSADP